MLSIFVAICMAGSFCFAELLCKQLKANWFQTLMVDLYFIFMTCIFLAYMIQEIKTIAGK